MKTTTIVIRKRGRCTLPAELREKYGVKEGDTFSLIDLGGSFLFTPRASQVTRLGDRIEQILQEKNLVPDDFLNLWNMIVSSISTNTSAKADL